MKHLDELYRHRIEQARQRALPVAHRKTFVNAVVKVFLRSALLPWCHLTRETRATISALHAQGTYRLQLEGLDEIAACDVYFGNHQGPSIPGGPQGGMEVLFSTQFVPDSTRYVLRQTLIDYCWPPTQCIKARAMRKPNPITVRGQDRLRKLRGKASWADIKQAAVGLKKERQRVASEIFRAVDAGTPVMIYPEGTRSVTGAILPFVSDFMRQTITDYIAPRTQSHRPRRIGLIVAETLQTFPDGTGRDTFICDRPVTMRGLLYDTSPIEKQYEQISHLRGEAYDIALTRLARTLALDMRGTFARELCDILADD